VIYAPCPACKGTGRVEAATEPISVLRLRTRTYNGLRRTGVHTVGQLLQLSDQDLMDIRQFGIGCLQDVHSALAAWHGQSLAA
jgi:DNA-directed RNA polymerase alpha subunit